MRYAVNAHEVLLLGRRVAQKKFSRLEPVRRPKQALNRYLAFGTQ